MLNTDSSGEFSQVLETIGSALLADPAVYDCSVLLRESAKGQSLIVVYFVALPTFQEDSAAAVIDPLGIDTAYPIAYIPMTSLPRDPCGEVDYNALARVPLITAGLTEQWEQELAGVAGVERVAVLATERSIAEHPLHCEDLLAQSLDGKLNGSCSSLAQAVTDEESAGQAEATDAPPREDRPGLSYGGDLVLPADYPRTLPEALKAAAAGDKSIVYVQQDGTKIEQSYHSLYDESRCILSGLRALGVQPQDRIILQIPEGREFIPAFWACVLGGYIPVPVSIAPTYTQINGPLETLRNAWQMLGQPIVLAGDGLAEKLRALPALLDLPVFQVEAVSALRNEAPADSIHNANPDDLTLLLLTSGSTGLPKAVTQNHTALLSMAAGTIQMNGFTPEDVTLNWMPLEHVGAVSFLGVMAVALGCGQVQVPTNYILHDPLRWLNLIETHRASISWAPNFAFSLLLKKEKEVMREEWDLSSMRFLVNAGEQVAAKTVRDCLRMLQHKGLPADALRPAFGMSETCSGITWSRGFTLEGSTDETVFVSLGPPIPGASVRIVDADGTLLPEGSTGHLHVSGPSITGGYLDNPEQNQKVFTQDGWFDTGDLGYLDEGQLVVTGREKEEIIVNGINYHSHQIESVAEAFAEVTTSYVSAFAVRPAGAEQDKLAVFFHTPIVDFGARRELIQKIRRAIIAKVGVTPDYLVPIDKDLVPKTSIGKIQHSAMGRTFLNGGYASQLREFDLLIGNENTIPDWHYGKVWKPVALPRVAPEASSQRHIVFLDTLGLGEALCQLLTDSGGECIRVESKPDSAYEQLASDHFRIDPGVAAHYHDLITSLTETAGPAFRVVHVSTYSDYWEEFCPDSIARTARDGLNSLLFLIQSLEEIQSSDCAVRLLMVGSHTQCVLPADTINPEKASTLGLLKSANQEYPRLQCGHLDLNPIDHVENAHVVLAELGALTASAEAAYRDGNRMIPCLSKVDIAHLAQTDLPFKQGGMYVISGGLGGIGQEISRYLLSHYEARLLLLGRTQINGQAKVATAEQSARSADLAAALDGLSQLPGDVAYESVDITDADKVRTLVQAAESRWACEVAGVFHLAGLAVELPIARESAASIAEVMRPKVLGAWSMHQLVKDFPDRCFVSFSSLSGFFGGNMLAAYASANSFLDAFVDYQRTQCGLPNSYCFAWGLWEGIGIGRDSLAKQALMAKGYQPTTVRSGLVSMLAAIERGQHHLLMGLDGENRNIARYRCDAAEPALQLSALFTSTTLDVPWSGLADLRLSDAFGTSTECRFQHLETMPLTESGDIDHASLQAEQRTGSQEYVAPQTETEHRVAEIWCEVLRITTAGIHDNYFDVGGDSLQAVQLLVEIEKRFDVTLGVHDLLEAPTIEGLSGLLDKNTSVSSVPALIPIRVEGDKPPLFLVPPAGTTVLGFHALAKHLDPDQPLYALQPVGMSGEAPPHDRVEDMARQYMDEIRAIQPDGPYYFGGRCFGGVVALEMAQQVVAAGQSVGLLAIMDTITPPLLVSRGMRYYAGEVFRRLLFFTRKGKLLSYLSFLVKSRVGKQNFEGIENENIQTVFAAHRKARSNYLAKVYPGIISYIQDEEAAGVSNPQEAWSKLTTQELNYIVVPGDHNSMFEEPFVKALAERLMECGLGRSPDLAEQVSKSSEQVAVL